MAITAADNIRILGPVFGTHTPRHDLLRSTSVAFKRGDPVAISSGNGAAASSSGVILSTLGGFAENPETASSGTGLQIIPAMPGIRFMAKLQNSASSSKIKTKHRFKRFGLKKYTSSSASVWVLDSTLATQLRGFIVTDLEDAASTVNGRLIFQVASQGENPAMSSASASVAAWNLW